MAHDVADALGGTRGTKKAERPGRPPRAPDTKERSGRSKDYLVRESLSQKLCALITNGTFKPGDHVTERELCERLKASRPSIRETLRQLEAEGLLDIYPNRGAVVRVLSVETFLELWEVRQALETLAAERFARHSRPEQIQRLDEAINRMDAALRAKDRKRIKTAKGEMFEAFTAGANNEMLAAYIRQINVRLSFLWSSSLMVGGRPAESIAELRTLLEAIKNGNADAARAAVVLYNEHAKATALFALKVAAEQREAQRASKRAG